MDPAKKPPPTPKKPRPSIRYDYLNPRDYLNYPFQGSCEQCSHYSFEKDLCTLGYVVQYHKAEFQKKSYELGGKVALCRFHEID